MSTAAIATLLPLVLPYGLQAVQALIAMFSKAGGPTDADWQALAAQTSITARQQMLNALATHSIEPTSPAGQAFLSLVP